MGLSWRNHATLWFCYHWGDSSIAMAMPWQPSMNTDSFSPGRWLSRLSPEKSLRCGERHRQFARRGSAEIQTFHFFISKYLATRTVCKLLVWSYFLRRRRWRRLAEKQLRGQTSHRSDRCLTCVFLGIDFMKQNWSYQLAVVKWAFLHIGFCILVLFCPDEIAALKMRLYCTFNYA